MAHHDWVPDSDPALGLFDVDLNYVESQPALILRDGKMYNVTWTTKSGQFEQESSRMRPIRFLNADGSSFDLKPGKTWVHVVMTGNPVYEVDSEIGTTLAPGSGHWKMPYISFKPGSREEVERQVEELKRIEYQLNGN